jgi:hypothetical protein
VRVVGSRWADAVSPPKRRSLSGVSRSQHLKFPFPAQGLHGPIANSKSWKFFGPKRTLRARPGRGKPAILGDGSLFCSSPPRGKTVRRSLLLKRCKFLSGNSLCDFYRLLSHNMNVSWLLPASTKVAGRNTFAMNNIESRKPPTTVKYPKRGTRTDSGESMCFTLANFPGEFYPGQTLIGLERDSRAILRQALIVSCPRRIVTCQCGPVIIV